MSIVSVRAALESALNGMSPALATAWENAPYSPIPGTPWQMVTLLPAEPDNREMNATHIERGLMQINLFYPLNAGPSAAETRAELIRDTFPRGASFTSGSVTAHIERTPEIGPGIVEDDWFMKPVRVRYYSFIRS